MIDADEPVLPNVKNGCCCSHGGRIINGYIRVSPCCTVHWCPVRIPKPITQPEDEINWKAPVRQSHQPPRMHVRKVA